MSLSLPPQLFHHCLDWFTVQLGRDPLAVSSSETPWQITIDLQTVVKQLNWKQNPKSWTTFFFFLIFFIFSDGLALLSGWRSLFLQLALCKHFPLSLQVVSQPGSGSAGVTFLVITSLALCIYVIIPRCHGQFSWKRASILYLKCLFPLFPTYQSWDPAPARALADCCASPFIAGEMEH